MATSSGSERGWRTFGIVMLAFVALGGAAGAVGTVVEYHALKTRGVRATAVVESAWRVKGGWNCSVSFTDTGDVRRAETVSGCGSVQRGQAISVTYDRSDPSTIDPTGSVTAARMLGLAVLLAAFSALGSFGVWAVLRKPAWDERRAAALRGTRTITGSSRASRKKRVRRRPRR